MIASSFRWHSFRRSRSYKGTSAPPRDSSLPIRMKAWPGWLVGKSTRQSRDCIPKAVYHYVLSPLLLLRNNIVVVVQGHYKINKYCFLSREGVAFKNLLLLRRLPQATPQQRNGSSRMPLGRGIAFVPPFSLSYSSMQKEKILSTLDSIPRKEQNPDEGRRRWRTRRRRGKNLLRRQWISGSTLLLLRSREMWKGTERCRSKLHPINILTMNAFKRVKNIYIYIRSTSFFDYLTNEFIQSSLKSSPTLIKIYLILYSR